MTGNTALGLIQFLRTIGYSAWVEDTNGNAIEETILKMAIKSAIAPGVRRSVFQKVGRDK